MLITLHLEHQTKTHDYWLIQFNGTAYTIRTRRNRLRKGIDNLRHVIQSAVGANTATLTFLGNSRVNGKWITEWIMQ